MAKLGTEKKPAIVCVQDEHRAEEVASIFDKKKIWGQGLTGCCLNRYFVSANFGEYFLFSESGLIYDQPMI